MAHAIVEYLRTCLKDHIKESNESLRSVALSTGIDVSSTPTHGDEVGMMN